MHLTVCGFVRLRKGTQKVLGGFLPHEFILDLCQYKTVSDQ